MATSYTVTEEVERLDRIARKLYGSERNGTVPLLLAANPGLASGGPLLPRGRTIVVPPRPTPAPDAAFVRPWE